MEQYLHSSNIQVYTKLLIKNKESERVYNKFDNCTKGSRYKR